MPKLPEKIQNRDWLHDWLKKRKDFKFPKEIGAAIQASIELENSKDEILCRLICANLNELNMAVPETTKVNELPNGERITHLLGLIEEGADVRADEMGDHKYLSVERRKAQKSLNYLKKFYKSLKDCYTAELHGLEGESIPDWVDKKLNPLTMILVTDSAPRKTGPKETLNWLVLSMPHIREIWETATLINSGHNARFKRFAKEILQIFLGQDGITDNTIVELLKMESKAKKSQDT